MSCLLKAVLWLPILAAMGKRGGSVLAAADRRIQPFDGLVGNVDGVGADKD
jgi:hypothetical protein